MPYNALIFKTFYEIENSVFLYVAEVALVVHAMNKPEIDVIRAKCFKFPLESVFYRL